MAKTTHKPRPRKPLIDLEPPPRAKKPESLTSREQDVVELIWAGFKSKEIGQLLRTAIQGGILRIR